MVMTIRAVISFHASLLIAAQRAAAKQQFCVPGNSYFPALRPCAPQSNWHGSC
ncbi:MAG TPA: hypothetical protein VGC21_15740 [Telluria sp.]|jgi:hypothetical protein